MGSLFCDATKRNPDGFLIAIFTIFSEKLAQPNQSRYVVVRKMTSICPEYGRMFLPGAVNA